MTLSEPIEWSGVLVLLGLFLMWLGHTKCRRAEAPPIHRDPLDNPFARRGWYTRTGNRLRVVGFTISCPGAAVSCGTVRTRPAAGRVRNMLEPAFLHCCNVCGGIRE